MHGGVITLIAMVVGVFVIMALAAFFDMRYRKSIDEEKEISNIIRRHDNENNHLG